MTIREYFPIKFFEYIRNGKQNIKTLNNKRQNGGISYELEIKMKLYEILKNLV